MKERNRYGRFAVGNKGGPGRPRKRVESEELRAIALEPPEGIEAGAWLDWLYRGRWWAHEVGGDVFEVRREDALRVIWIQFRIVTEGNGRKYVSVIGERVERDPVAEYTAERERRASFDDEV